jgi:predicted DNA-binding transcriptional regulator AlpA
MPRTSEAVAASELQRDPPKQAPRPPKPRSSVPVELLDARQVNEMLGISDNTRRRLIKAGTLSPGVLLGKRARRWRRDVVLEDIRSFPAA